MWFIDEEGLVWNPITCAAAQTCANMFKRLVEYLTSDKQIKRYHSCDALTDYVHHRY